MSEIASIATAHQSAPVELSEAEQKAKYPACIVSLIEGGQAKRYHATVVGRCIAEVPHLDVMLRGTKRVINNLPADQVEILAGPRRIA